MSEGVLHPPERCFVDLTRGIADENAGDSAHRYRTSSVGVATELTKPASTSAARLPARPSQSGIDVDRRDSGSRAGMSADAS